jgi:RHS repeat-associated protein
MMRLLLVCAAAALLPGRAAAQVVEYYHTDALGSVRAVTSQSGSVIERHDYLPFGEEWCAGPPAGVCGAVSPGQPKRFTGKERDAETGLDYFGARYYGAKVGRFTTIDPVYTWRENLVDPQRWNRYVYGRNNPLRYVDPDGKDFIDAVDGAITAFGSNLAWGANRPERDNRDFRIGQAIGDAASVVAGGFEFHVGAGAAGVGLVTAETGVGVAVAGAGVATAAHGLGVSASGLIHLSKIGSEGGPGAGKRFSEKTKDAARAENPNCVFCDRPTTQEPGPTQSNIDHAKPKSRGGNNTTENAQHTCRECNQKKGAKSTEEFLKQ